ncbi:uncharacterized protein An04g08180 [Aspergillus niger]|uniref:Contig An04c0260, genomic contig n=2 Tax=Aspergillus niger TaxID=5061 RepID=A2QJT3_ASPNC|nr:uncharacterized protein An04g08180 [Aspergillus niger]CAK44784.1 unnamed protein product [Aspergillus niger]
MGRKTGWQVSKRIKITQWVPEGILLVERGGGHDNKQQHCREKPRASQPLAADCVGYAFVRFSRGHGMMSMGGIGGINFSDVSKKLYNPCTTHGDKRAEALGEGATDRRAFPRRKALRTEPGCPKTADTQYDESVRHFPREQTRSTATEHNWGSFPPSSRRGANLLASQKNSGAGGAACPIRPGLIATEKLAIILAGPWLLPIGFRDTAKWGCTTLSDPFGCRDPPALSQCSIADQHGQVKTLKPLAVPVVTPLVTPIPSDPEGMMSQKRGAKHGVREKEGKG